MLNHPETRSNEEFIGNTHKGQAAIDFMHKNGITSARLGEQAYDEDELLLWLNNCSDFIEFREPDLNNQVTAIAKVSSGEEFKNLKLM